MQSENINYFLVGLLNSPGLDASPRESSAEHTDRSTAAGPIVHQGPTPPPSNADLSNTNDSLKKSYFIKKYLTNILHTRNITLGSYKDY